MAFGFYCMQNDKECEKILLEVDISGHCNILQHTATRGFSINQLTGVPAHFVKEISAPGPVSVRDSKTAQERDNFKEKTKNSL